MKRRCPQPFDLRLAENVEEAAARNSLRKRVAVRIHREDLSLFLALLLLVGGMAFLRPRSGDAIHAFR